jgi:hypothetical protein
VPALNYFQRCLCYFFILKQPKKAENKPGSKIKSLSSRFLTIASIVCDAAILVSQFEFITSVFNYNINKSCRFRNEISKTFKTPFPIVDQAH